MGVTSFCFLICILLLIFWVLFLFPLWDSISFLSGPAEGGVCFNYIIQRIGLYDKEGRIRAYRRRRRRRRVDCSWVSPLSVSYFISVFICMVIFFMRIRFISFTIVQFFTIRWREASVPATPYSAVSRRDDCSTMLKKSQLFVLSYTLSVFPFHLSAHPSSAVVAAVVHASLTPSC